jgi:hypothetical protein
VESNCISYFSDAFNFKLLNQILRNSNVVSLMIMMMTTFGIRQTLIMILYFPIFSLGKGYFKIRSSEKN